MTREEQRRLLMEFAEFIDLRSDATPGAGEFREATVERFLNERQPGFAGYSDDELKGTAR